MVSIPKNLIPRFGIIFDFLIRKPKWESIVDLVNSCLEPALSYQGMSAPKKIYIKDYDPGFYKSFGNEITSIDP